MCNHRPRALWWKLPTSFQGNSPAPHSRSPAMRHLSLLLALLLCPAAVRPDDPPDKELKPAEAKKILAQRLGEWDVETKINKAAWSPKALSFKSRESVKLVLGGQFIQVTSKNPDGKETSRVLATYDTAAKVFRYWYFDTTGNNSTGTGTWDEKTKTITWTNSLVGGGTSKASW